ncbi:MAG: ClbS/DfsB family four-helix bundle protein [Actinomycetia bacterium]|nr:ClbS/DfsB family four-helix bundle protein [Actinomycetes bacterium]
MPATTKDQLLLVCHKEFAKLEKTLEQVGSAMSLAKDPDDTCIKDVVAHRAHWIDLFLGWYEDGLAGKEVFFPAEGYKWNDLKRYNADVRLEQVDVGWDQARAMLVLAHGDLVNLIESCSQRDLYGGPMAGANNHWTTGRWAEAAGPSHYRSAAKYVRSRLRQPPLGTGSEGPS